MISPALQRFLDQIREGQFAWRDLLGIDRWETTWVPVRTGWTDVGTPTVAARFRVIGRSCQIQARVTPATTVATVAGTSYISLPIAAQGYAGVGTMVDASTNVAIGVCAFDIANSRIYVPSQAATANVLAIAGWYEV